MASSVTARSGTSKMSRSGRSMRAVADKGGVLLVDQFEAGDGGFRVVEVFRRYRHRAVEMAHVRLHGRPFSADLSARSRDWPRGPGTGRYAPKLVKLLRRLAGRAS